MESIISSPRIKDGDEIQFKMEWLEVFKRKKKRPPRILYVGNIANIAYANAKHHRNFGVEIDVLCCDYYHIMGCPEWEDITMSYYSGSDFFPRFNKKEIGNYQPPEWFMQGPFLLCFEYIKSKHSNRKRRTDILYRLMRLSRNSVYHYYGCKIIGYILAGHLKMFFFDVKRFFNKMLRKKRISARKNLKDKDAEYLIQEFNHLFPERADQLTFEDLEPFLARKDHWRIIASYYDIIQCYGSDPIWPLVARINTYLAFEHGTLREFTMRNDSLNRLVALAYRKARHVFISNGDCLSYAKRLQIKNYSKALHPIEFRLIEYSNDVKTAIKQEYNADILLFCPMRHDWAIKGPDIHLRALPYISQRLPGKVKLILNSWGLEVEKSRQLIHSLGCQEQIVWLQPLCRKKLIEIMQASDVVLDQMVLPCFGGIVPQALAVGTPVIMSYQPQSTDWMFNEPAPILSAFTLEDVVRSVIQAIEPDWRSEFKVRALNWVKNYHHPNNIVQEHFKVYENLMAN